MKKIILKYGILIFCMTITTHIFAQQNESAEEILAKMTQDEKIKELYGYEDFLDWNFKSMLHQGLTNKSVLAASGGLKKYNIPRMHFADGHKGIAAGGRYTSYPPPVVRGSSFDKELEYRLGMAISIDAQAAGATAFGGCTNNLLRNPRGGRSEESYGEDTFLASIMGTEFVKGIQADHRIMAVGKHFAVYNIENNRHNVNAVIDERSLMEVYLPQFKRMVQEGNVAALMSAYNKINGEYCGDNSYLLTDILRKDWGFKGFVTSDWIYGSYSTAKAMKAGLNQEMPAAQYYSKENILKAIDNNELTWADIDAALLPLLRQKLSYGPAKPHNLSSDVIAKNRALSQEAAEKGMVLIKNDNVLPFDVNKVKTVLIVGELAKNDNAGEPTYAPDVPLNLISTPYKGIKKYLKEKGINVWYTDGRNRDELERLGSRADAIVVCVGMTGIDAAEFFYGPEGKSIVPVVGGGDRDNLNLHNEDISLISMCTRYNHNMAVVYFGGSASMVKNWIGQAPSLLFAGFPGMEGGKALANVLFGEVSPSGKLCYSIFENENDYPSFPNSHLQEQQPWEIQSNKFQSAFDVKIDHYLGYTLADKKNIPVSYSFGYGLSYTTFELSGIATDKTSYNENDVIKIQCTVKNTGKMKGGEVVQAYVGFKDAKVEMPVKLLKGFQKTYLDSGASAKVEITIPVKDLAYWDVNTKSWKVEKMAYQIYVGNSSRAEDLQKLEISVN